MVPMRPALVDIALGLERTRRLLQKKSNRSSLTILKTNSWSPCSINLIDLAAGLGATAEILKLQKLDDSFRYSLPRFDQTMTPVGECGIELILRKRPDEEAAYGGRKPVQGLVSKMEAYLLTGFQFD